MSLIEIAEGLYDEGKYLCSLEFVLETLEKEKNNLKALELKATLYYVMNRLPEAINPPTRNLHPS